LGGLPVVEHVRQAAVRADCGEVVVATDSRDVLDAVERSRGAAVLTSRTCPSGTDRVAQAASMVEGAEGKRFAAVVNIQGDEPFIAASTIKRVTKLALESSGTDIATAVTPFTRREDPTAPQAVKAVVAKDGRCLYFSRSLVPHIAGERLAPLKHIGIYA